MKRERERGGRKGRVRRTGGRDDREKRVREID